MTLRVSNGAPFTVLAPIPALRTGIRVDVYDRDAPATLLAIVGRARGREWNDQLNDTGSGTFFVHEDDPVLVAVPTLLRYGNIVRFKLDNVDRFAFRIENLKRGVAPAGEDAARWIEVSGRGVLSMLEDALIYPQGNVPSGDPERPFNGMTAGGVMERMVNQAQDRGALAGVTLGFDEDLDSNNQPFEEDLDLSERAGTDLLSLARRHAELTVDVYMTPQLDLRYYNTRGVDRSFQIVNAPPIMLRRAHEIADATHESEGVIKNVLLIEGPSAWTERSDGGSITEHGRREAYLSLGNTTSAAQITQASDATLRVTADPAEKVAFRIEDRDGNRPYVDFDVGDWVLIPEPDGEFARYRVRGITVSEDDNGVPIFVPEFGSIQAELDERLQKWLRRMTPGTVGGLASDVASPKLNQATQEGIDAAVDDHESSVLHVDELGDLTDVNTTGVSDGDVLTYDAGANEWVPQAPAAAGGGTENLALGKPYTLTNAPNGSYPEFVVEKSTSAATAFASAGGMLTNGDRADAEDFAIGFLGFSNTNPIVRIDLGSAQAVRLVRAWGMYGSDLIYRPIGIKVEYSADDVTYTTVEDRTGLAGGAQPGRRHWLLEVDASAAPARRYWRVTLTRDTANQWTFVSEVELWS